LIIGEITVPNFVPCVPEFVPYFDVNAYHWLALERILRGFRYSFCPKGLRDLDRYEMISDRIHEF
jgi:hypothetical protein